MATEPGPSEQTPAVSVIVPLYDNEEHIERCLRSLHRQRGLLGSSEIVVVNNGSRDRSAEIVEEFGQSLLSEPRAGAYFARNRGLLHTSAPLIAFTDADCSVDPGWLAAIQQAMTDPDVGVVLGHCSYPSEASWELHWLGRYENAKAKHVLERCPPQNHFAYTNNMAVRASVFEQIGPFEEWERAADTELLHRMRARLPQMKVLFVPEMKVNHLEFMKARKRMGRLRLYTSTNRQIPTFRELTLRQRLAVFVRAVLGS